MNLYYETFGDKGSAVLILHGLFGASANWRTVAKRLGSQHRVYVVDQRNHGRSPHAPGMTYDHLARDAMEFLDARDLNRATVIGHSMGGKAAMKLALLYPERVEGLVAVDIAPGAQSPAGARPALDALLEIDPSGAATRASVESRLAEFLPDTRLRKFMLTNLTRNCDGSYRWRVNVHAIATDFETISGPLEARSVYEGPALFVRGGTSEYVRDSDRNTIRRLFPAADIVTIPGAGHWLHADRPDAFVALVLHFLSRTTASA